MHRSELVAIDFSDLVFSDEGVVIRVQRSKTDREGVGRDDGSSFGADLETGLYR
jgi:hypothetical protein